MELICNCMGPDARCLDILAATMKEEGDDQPSAALMQKLP